MDYLSGYTGNEPHPYVILARKSIENTARDLDPSSGIDFSGLLRMPVMNIHRACFVSIKNKSGSLRGCIGTIMPVFSSIWEEIVENAHAAACRDPRFQPVNPDEVGQCRISVDVLEVPELISDPSKLDPKIYGVIVEKGNMKGVLLPDLEGIDSCEQQISIAMNKANILSAEGMTLWRFKVSRYKE